ncbi:hypothetical protein FHR97_001909 [Halomonas stenophila]|uniref:Uncharacterized protein n=1 Tax=Halomonas stenophila TaxID=795312 RepID=A0A7W5HL18_9GAMM|nr:hypothetical protein [Halomonas stenophila]
MSRFRDADHSHNSATTVRAGIRRGHSKGHPNDDKQAESPAVARLRERLSRVKA